MSSAPQTVTCFVEYSAIPFGSVCECELDWGSHHNGPTQSASLHLGSRLGPSVCSICSAVGSDECRSQTSCPGLAMPQRPTDCNQLCWSIQQTDCKCLICTNFNILRTASFIFRFQIVLCYYKPQRDLSYCVYYCLCLQLDIGS